VCALLARVQLKAALGAFRAQINLILEDRPTLGTAGNHAATGHLDGARAKRVLTDGSFPLLLFGGLFLTAVLVPALAIFH